MADRHSAADALEVREVGLLSGWAVSYDPRRDLLTITWQLDPDDAEDIGYVLEHAALAFDGSVRDRGFYEDGRAFLEAAWQAQDMKDEAQHDG
jgi:hypothetical protein